MARQGFARCSGFAKPDALTLALTARICAATLAAIGLVALVMQARVSAGIIGDTASPGTVLWVMSRYFTVLTNVLVFLSFAMIAATGRPHAARLGGFVVWIVIVGIVYHTILARLWMPEGIAR